MPQKKMILSLKSKKGLNSGKSYRPYGEVPCIFLPCHRYINVQAPSSKIKREADFSLTFSGVTK